MLMRALTVLAAWIVSAGLLLWPRLPGPARRRLALLFSAAGLVSLVLAMGTEGVRESPTLAVFLLGKPYLTEKASASAGLPYYVLTGAFLSLGFFGLALGDQEARVIARRVLWHAIALSWLVTALRFLLEKAAAPTWWTYAVGVTWMAPVVGAFLATGPEGQARSGRSLVSALVVYAFATRGVVALLMVAATTLRLGSHYDVSPLALIHSPFTGAAYHFESGSPLQIASVALLPQLIVWPIYTVLTGLLGAAVVRFIRASWTPPGPAVEGAPARPD
jgi:hypothetical protein